MGEIANVLQQNGLLISQNFEEIGLEIHVAAMIFFSVLLWFRFYYYHNSQKRLADNFGLQPPASHSNSKIMCSVYRE